LGGAFLARRFGTLRRARSERRFTVNRATTATEWDWEWSRGSRMAGIDSHMVAQAVDAADEDP